MLLTATESHEHHIITDAADTTKKPATAYAACWKTNNTHASTCEGPQAVSKTASSEPINKLQVDRRDSIHRLGSLMLCGRQGSGQVL